MEGEKKNKIRERIDSIGEILENASDSEQEKHVWDKALDILEILIEASPTKIDDFLLKPIIAIIRRKYDIPDND